MASCRKVTIAVVRSPAQPRRQFVRVQSESALRHMATGYDYDERRAAMVSNLMVVLCSERDTQPIVNTGTLYT